MHVSFVVYATEHKMEPHGPLAAVSANIGGPITREFLLQIRESPLQGVNLVRKLLNSFPFRDAVQHVKDVLYDPHLRYLS